MKNFVGIGGGEISKWSFKSKDDNQDLYETKEIDEYIVNLSKKETPKVLFIGIASKENDYYFKAIKRIYEALGCMVENLEILSFLDGIKEDMNVENRIAQFETRMGKIREEILSSDILYIGGGKTKFLIDILKETNLDKILLEAFEKEIIIAGFSAGCYSFFDYNYELLEGLKVIKAISCVHYNEKSEEKKEEFYEAIRVKKLPGIALDNGTAIHYFDNKFKIIKSNKKAKAVVIKFENNEFVEQELKENIEYDINVDRKTKIN